MSYFNLGQYVKYTAENAPAFLEYRGKIGRIINLVNNSNNMNYAFVKFFDGRTLELFESNLELVTQDEIMIYRLEN